MADPTRPPATHILAAICLSALIATAATAQAVSDLQADAPQVDGNTLHDWCTTDPRVCTAFIQGFITGNARADFYAARRYSALCIPSGTTTSAAVQVAQDYLATNLQDRHRDAGLLLMRAFTTTWPMREATCRIGFNETAAPR